LRSNQVHLFSKAGGKATGNAVDNAAEGESLFEQSIQRTDKRDCRAHNHDIIEGPPIPAYLALFDYFQYSPDANGVGRQIRSHGFSFDAD
jgi:hypothetical protein